MEYIKNPLQLDEEIFLTRACLKDGMSPKQTTNYIQAMNEHLINLKPIKQKPKKRNL